MQINSVKMVEEPGYFVGLNGNISASVKKCIIYFVDVLEAFILDLILFYVIQGVSEIGALILTGNRTHQKE
jgi:hypothetical protein